jgi:integrase
LKKLFKSTPIIHWDIIEKETVDELIFRTTKTRNRLILELMARGGMRIGEVLKLTPKDRLKTSVKISGSFLFVMELPGPL